MMAIKIIHRIYAHFFICSGPGPGHYNVSSAFTRTNRRKGATIKSRNTPQDTFQTPGPGRYMLDAYADMQAKAKRRGFTMTARGHKDKSRFPGPGPGSYNIPSTFEKTNRAATIKSRAALTARLSSHLDTPGPGAYNVDKSHIDASRKKAPQFSMGIRRGVGESAVSPLKQKTGRRKKKFGRRKNMRGYQTQRQGYGFGNYQPMNMYSPAGYYDQNYNYVDNNNYNPYAQQQPTYHQGIPYHHQYEEQGNDPFAE